MRPLTHAVPGALIQLLAGAPLSDGKVGFAWNIAVGPAMARATAVKLERGVLVVETASMQWVREIKRSSGLIVTRMRELLGEESIDRLDVRTNPNLKPINLQSH